VLLEALNRWDFVLVWGLVATVVMTTILYGSQGLGLSRLSLSFLVGTFFTGNRSRANVVGFIVYMIGGWLFAFIYVLMLVSIDLPGAWLGTVTGLVHGIFLLTVILPLLPYVHPRMATEYDGPSHIQRLEPPGFMGLNYGYRTPLTTLLAQTFYGAILGVCFQMI
jgi:hypothetical protein